MSSMPASTRRSDVSSGSQDSGHLVTMSSTKPRRNAEPLSCEPTAYFISFRRVYIGCIFIEYTKVSQHYGIQHKKKTLWTHFSLPFLTWHHNGADTTQTRVTSIHARNKARVSIALSRSVLSFSSISCLTLFYLYLMSTNVTLFGMPVATHV